MISAASPPGPTLSAAGTTGSRRTVASTKLGFGRESRPGGSKLSPLQWMGCFMDGVKRGKKAEEASAEPEGTPDHLVIMVNGLNGSPENWRFAAEQFLKRLPNKVIVHRSKCNSSRLTYDGVDMMGDRLADEVRSVVNSRSGVQKISFVAHSLGGLVARYAVGRLYEPSNSRESSYLIGNHLVEDKILEGRIAGLEPMNFITVASPHLGSRGHKQLPCLCGLPFLERTVSETAHFIVGRTGRHLFLTDNDDGRPPLLVRMVDDCDIKFRSALSLFKRRVVYANAKFDHMVGWRTSSIRRQHELPKVLVTYARLREYIASRFPYLLVEDMNYPHIVNVDKGINDNKYKGPASDIAGPNNDPEEEMVKGLTQVSWERVDVSFQKSRQRYIAHNTIQVNSYWLNSDGADVIFHMIDNFLM